MSNSSNNYTENHFEINMVNECGKSNIDSEGSNGICGNKGSKANGANTRNTANMNNKGNTSSINGVVLINKPSGMTSFRVTATVKRMLGVKKAGHAGTLDPMASGVLPVMVGRATHIIDLIEDGKKRYKARLLLGLTTDTLDCEGEVLTDQPVSVSEQQLFAALAEQTGEIMQVPPMYSALKSNGKKLYELARSGIEIERPARPATVYSAELISFDGEYAEIDVVCSKGTYIRTLIDDIGLALGCGAIMTALERTRSNGFEIAECVDYYDFAASENAGQFLLPADCALGSYGAVCVTENQARRFVNGGELFLSRLHLDGESALYRVYYNDYFLGLGAVDGDCLKPECVLVEGSSLA